MKRFLSMILVLVMVCGFLPAVAMTANADHEHVAGDWWLSDDSGHWNQCVGGANCEERVNYAPHDLSTYSKYCTICEQRLDHFCYNADANCEDGGRCDYCPYGAPENPDNHKGRYGVPIDDNTHQVVCFCGHVYVESEPHQFNHWDDIEGQPGMEESWCETPGCMHVATRPKQHSHSYSQATCISPAACSCGATTGDKNSSNHAGGTEVRGAVAATEENEGYTGDTYCKGCGVKIKTGEVIPRKNSGTSTPGTEPNTPDTEANIPDTEANTPDTEANIPDTEANTPDTEANIPDTEANTPDTEANTSDTEGNTSGTEANTPGTDSTAPDSADNSDNAPAPDNDDPDKDNSDPDGDSLLWLWILLAVVVAGGAVTAVILVKKKNREMK